MKNKIFFVVLLLVTRYGFCDNENRTVHIFVQPCDGVQFFIDGTEVKYKKILQDKTLGMFEANIHRDARELSIEKTGYQPKIFFLQKEFFLYDYEFCISPRAFSLQRKPRTKPYTIFIALDKINSRCRFVNAFDCASKPKSLSFINEYTLIIPLLDDEGFQVMNIKNGTTRLIRPPEKYAKQRGFVESLYLKHKEEIWVSQMTTACVHVFSAQDFSYITTIQSSGSWSKVLAYNPVTNDVYLSNWLSKNISVIDPDTYREKKVIPLSRVPRGIEISADGTTLYFAEFEDASGASTGHVLKFSLEDVAVKKSLGVRGAKRHCVKDDKRNLLYVSDMSKKIIEVFSLVDDSLVATIPVYDNPNTIVLSSDKRYLIVSCRGPNNPDKGYLYAGYRMGQVYIIDTQNFKTCDIIEGGNQPTGLAFSPDGKTFAFSDFLDARIRIYELK